MTMNDDPVLQEAWRIKDENGARYDYDIRRMAHELKEEEERSGREVVSFAPRRISSKPPTPKRRP
jgi:hypothetical protein